jgi:hypothetical protein
VYNNTVLLCIVCCDLRDNERQQHKEEGGDKRQYNTAVTDVLTEVCGGRFCCDGGWLWLLRYSGNIAGGTSSLPTLAIFPGSEFSGGIDPSPISGSARTLLPTECLSCSTDKFPGYT